MNSSKRHILSVMVIALAACTFWASAVQKTQQTIKTYADTSNKKKDKTTTQSYDLPTVVPIDKIPQEQVKGGVTISCEVIPFSVSERIITDTVPFYRNPSKPDYDVMEVASKKTYTVGPDKVKFKIRIKNNQERVLKLHDCAIVIIIDGVQYSMNRDVTTIWENTLIVSGFEKEIFIEGPDIISLQSMKVIDIFINDVPTSYNEAGVILRKSNFEWLFSCGVKTVTQEHTTTYSYAEIPVRQERCVSCSGIGYTEAIQTCYNCNGSGRVQSILDSKYYTCTRCSGGGRINVKTNCTNCSATGVRKLYRSPLPPLTAAVTWTGWKVKVKTTPSFAKIQVVDVRTGQYEKAGVSDQTVQWYSPTGTQFPILITSLAGTTVKVLPFNAKGKEIETIEVDFSKDPPKVKKGTLVQ